VFGPRKKNLSVLGLEEEEVAAEVEEEEVEELFIEDMPPRTIIPFVRNDSDEESEVEDSGNLSPAIPPGSQEVGEETPN
jgi:hypothetical protein